MAEEKARWYVVHTYSGYENKVATDLRKIAENQKEVAELIVDVMVPIEEVVENRSGKAHTIQHKIFPGYVLVKMIKTPRSWYAVRNTRGVTGFVGPQHQSCHRLGVSNLAFELYTVPCLGVTGQRCCPHDKEHQGNSF